MRALLLWCVWVPAVHAAVTLAPLFSDDAVLQRDKLILVWGWGTPGEKLRVQFHAQQRATTVSAAGAWQVKLAPEPASAVPSEMEVDGSVDRVIRKGILVGEVWLCSGQSNMEWSVEKADGAAETIATANRPTIREFKIPRGCIDRPQLRTAGKWTVCQPATVGKFSAVGFYFAIHRAGTARVPIGIINASYGGTAIESWVPEAALQTYPDAPIIYSHWQNVLHLYPERLAGYQAALRAWQTAQVAALAQGRAFTKPRPVPPEGPGSRWRPASIYNAMINPLVPFALQGIVWYQGETNGDRQYGAIGPAEYRALFPLLITQWRAAFQQPELPFYFVQIANCVRRMDPTRCNWAFLREAQAQTLALPNTGMVVTIDIGDAKNIHPGNKNEVGRRLALLTDKSPDAPESSGPRLLYGEPQPDGSVKLHFSHATGLASSLQPLVSFEAAGEDGHFVAAVARIEGETVIVSNSTKKRIISVRYAWTNNPVACLYNGAHLPAAPFRTDDL